MIWDEINRKSFYKYYRLVDPGSIHGSRRPVVSREETYLTITSWNNATQLAKLNIDRLGEFTADVFLSLLLVVPRTTPGRGRYNIAGRNKNTKYELDHDPHTRSQPRINRPTDIHPPTPTHPHTLTYLPTSTSHHSNPPTQPPTHPPNHVRAHQPIDTHTHQPIHPPSNQYTAAPVRTAIVVALI